MEILHEFFLNTPGISTSFLIDPWNLCIPFWILLNTAENSISLTPPCLVFFSGIAHSDKLLDLDDAAMAQIVPFYNKIIVQYVEK